MFVLETSQNVLKIYLERQKNNNFFKHSPLDSNQMMNAQQELNILSYSLNKITKFKAKLCLLSFIYKTSFMRALIYGHFA